MDGIVRCARRGRWVLALVLLMAGVGITGCDLAGPQVSTASLPIGTYGQAYAGSLSARGGSSPYHWSATGLPAGLHLDANQITGTPTGYGGYSVHLTVADGLGHRANRDLLLLINNADQGTALGALNGDRQSLHLPPLAEASSIAMSAQAWALHMAQTGALAHDLPFSDWAPSCARGYGENVGTGASVAAIEAAFMASSHHRPQIVSTTFTQVGLGVVRSGNVYWVVQRFIVGC